MANFQTVLKAIGQTLLFSVGFVLLRFILVFIVWPLEDYLPNSGLNTVFWLLQVIAATAIAIVLWHKNYKILSGAALVGFLLSIVSPYGPME